ncbi:hypothetical protein MSG28_006295 [Choristoneura fumiferana]|uniref:Uncharacterized protein n=1 Tax=Choristoneura fumiferana TaxID=7141 RepID=A0ACC0JED0_CHOFU|nr:hypothetical protein MSG28_006295 [Choristoneura fumiferana]
MLSGPLMQRAGRKRTLQMAAPLWAAGWLLLGFAPSFPLILLGRFVSGLCVGFSLAPAQVYVSECCDPEIRGQLGSLPTLSMSLGIVLSYITGKWLYWRHLAFFSATFCGKWLYWRHLAFFSATFCVWLEGKGLDATASLKWLQLSSRAVAVVKDDEVPEKSDAAAPAAPPSLFTREVFCSSSVIKPLIVGFALLFFQQFSGIDAVIFFTVEIFESAGSTLDPMVATIIVGVVQLVCNGVSTMLVDRAGRRPLLLLSGAVMCVSMFAMGTAYYLELQHSAWLGNNTYYRTVLTSAGTFWMYACFCAIAFFFVLFMVPETKGKSLAEIEQHFRALGFLAPFSHDTNERGRHQHMRPITALDTVADLQVAVTEVVRAMARSLVSDRIVLMVHLQVADFSNRTANLVLVGSHQSNSLHHKEHLNLRMGPRTLTAHREPAKYEFNYEVDDSQTGTKFGHSEQRDGDVATGEYNVVLPDGRKQVVPVMVGQDLAQATKVQEVVLKAIRKVGRAQETSPVVTTILATHEVDLAVEVQDLANIKSKTIKEVSRTRMTDYHNKGIKENRDIREEDLEAVETEGIKEAQEAPKEANRTVRPTLGTHLEVPVEMVMVLRV